SLPAAHGRNRTAARRGVPAVRATPAARAAARRPVRSPLVPAGARAFAALGTDSGPGVRTPARVAVAGGTHHRIRGPAVTSRPGGRAGALAHAAGPPDRPATRDR